MDDITVATSEAYDREREDLEALIQSPGWARFIAQQNAEWGATAYAAKIERAVAQVPASPVAGEMARETVFQITSVRKALLNATNWPVERLKRLYEMRKRSLAQ